MTQKHSLPSKLEEFITIAAAALGFSILFLFALSAFVNNLYQRDGDIAHGPVIAANSSHGTDRGAPAKTTPATHDTPAAKPAAKPAGTPPKAMVSIGQLLAKGDAKKGAKVAKKCFACHSFDDGGKNKVGPNLYGIVGKKIGTAKKFKYSKAMLGYAGKTDSWNYGVLVAFLKKPKAVVPKTKMAFAGLKKDKDMANLIAYLRGNAKKPVPLPAP